MPDPGLQFSRVRAAGELQWHVHRAGRFIGAILERGGGCEASRSSTASWSPSASPTATPRPPGWRSWRAASRIFSTVGLEPGPSADVAGYVHGNAVRSGTSNARMNVER